MDGLAVLLGHLVGDYIVQNDWQAKNKVIRAEPWGGFDAYGPDGEAGPIYRKGHPIFDKALAEGKWEHGWGRELSGHIACTVHCLLYTLAIAVFSFWWMPLWGYVACFFIHWPVDRFRLARWWMVNVSGQKAFATEALSPWSIIVVDNVFHLLTLYGIWVATLIVTR